MDSVVFSLQKKKVVARDRAGVKVCARPGETGHMVLALCHVPVSQDGDSSLPIPRSGLRLKRHQGSFNSQNSIFICSQQGLV